MALKSKKRRLTAAYPLTLALLVGAVGGAAIINNNYSTGDQLRTYRIAIAATGEFTDHHGGTKAGALAAIKDIVTELNKTYEAELAIHLELVSDALQNKIIYTDAATDPYTPGNRSLQIDQNQTTLDTEIGAANYDIGHVVSKVAADAGGIAGLGVVGIDGSKAKGISETQTPAASDFGFLGVITHEIGHQFGAEHTFNAEANGSCLNNRVATNAYEPASGSTIMSYAGICGTDNLQLQEDLYFHAASLEQINEYLKNTAAAAPNQSTATGNAVPVVNGGLDHVIPANTPFELTAAATDGNGDTLTYVWEQLDAGASMGLPLSDNSASPIFRSFPPSTDPVRTFPRLSNLLTNTTDPGEILPTTDRNLNFRVTVRDNRPGGGGVHSDDVLVDVQATGAPFLLTAPNGGEAFTGATSQTVTWNVAGTNANGINAAQVDIFLSTNGGQSFPFLLATTANDGSESLVMPNINTTRARLKIRGTGNIFFDVSNANFSLTSDPGAPGITRTQSGGSTVVTEDGVMDSYQLKLNTAPGGDVTVTASSEPETELSTDGATFSSVVALTFNSTSPQTVFVRAIDDSVREGGHNSIITHAVTSSTSATYPMSMLVNQIDARVVDNESRPVVGVDLDFSDSHPTPDDWTTLVLNAGSKSLTDLVRDDSVPTNIDLTLTYDGGGFISWNSSGGANNTKPRHVPALDLLDGFNSGSKPLTAVWSDLVPGRQYGIVVFGLDASASDTLAQNVTITGATALPLFAQALVDNEIHVNDVTGSDTQDLKDYEKTVAANASGEIIVRIEPTGADGIGLAGLSIREILPTVPGITVTPLAIAEGAATGTYQLNLNTAPAGTLTMALDADADTEISLDGGTTFATTQTLSLNNTVARIITVRAVDDAAVEGLHTSTICHTILSSTSTDYPVTLALDPASVSIQDNDVFGPLLGVDFDDGNQTTPTGWTRVQSLFSGGANLPFEDGTASTIDLSIVTAGGTATGPSSPDAATIPMHTPSLEGVDFVYLHDGSRTIRFIWRDLVAGGLYNVYVFAAEPFRNLSIDQTVTITGQGTATAFTQVTPNNNELWVNGQKGSSSSPVESYAVPIAASPAGEIDIALTGNPGATWAYFNALAIQEAPSNPGITVDVGNGLNLMEGGATDTYTIKLDSSPTGAVQLTVTSDGQTEFSLDGTTFASTQSFVRTDTNPQTITVRAIDDTLAENVHTSRITHTITMTADPAQYPMGSVIKRATAAIEDNDLTTSATVSIAATDADGAEPSEDGEFTVSIDANLLAPAGGLTVNFTVGGTATNGADYANIGSSVTIPAGVNSVVVPIDVSDDTDLELPESVIVTLTSTNTPGFNIAAAPNHTATVIITSDEQTPYQAFLTAFFAVNDLLDPAKEATQWGPGVDLDKDTLTTIQEFFHNLSPSVYDADPISSDIVTDGGVTYLEIVFRRRKDHQGVQQIIEQGPSPATDDWLTFTGFTEIVTSIDTQTEEVRIRYNLTGLARGFLRLKLQGN